MVINTVLSFLAYDYPPEKLNVYLSDDDAGSELMFYGLLEASAFAKHWLPFCKKFQVKTTSPGAYFSNIQQPDELLDDVHISHDWLIIKKLYNQMQDRIKSATLLGRVSRETKELHKGFQEWNSNTTTSVHQAIVQPILGLLPETWISVELSSHPANALLISQLNIFLSYGQTDRSKISLRCHTGTLVMDERYLVILIDGKSSMSLDCEGQILPKLVYVAREKRTYYIHNFKAGALNALIRVSSVISNSPIILTVDCDVCSDNSESVRDAMCCFMDEENGNKIAFVQFPESSYNLTANDLYASCFRVPNELEMRGMDANGGPCYIGSGCFHRRAALCGARYTDNFEPEWITENTRNEQESTSVLQERCKSLASCAYEKDTQWGKEVGGWVIQSIVSLLSSRGLSGSNLSFFRDRVKIGLKYGFPSEDIVTGLAIQSRGWKSIYLNPKKKGFVGLAPTTLLDVLVQHKRWSEGQFSILLSKCCPFVFGYKKIPFKLQMSYTLYLLWAANCLPTLAYVTIPQLSILKDIPVFPRVSSLWMLPFLYVIISQYIYSLGEFVFCGGSVKGWWNEQRMWLFKRTTCYLIAFLDSLLGQLGFSELGFTVTPKMVNEDVLLRYEQEVMEFGSDSGMFTGLAFNSMLNVFGLFWSLKKLVMDPGNRVLDRLALQIGLCVVVVWINLPVYEGLFIRKDVGKMPTSVTCNSVILALMACILVLYSNI